MMTLELFREKTRELPGDIGMMVFLPEVVSGDVIERTEIEVEIKSVDLDTDINDKKFLSLSSGEPGDYSL